MTSKTVTLIELVDVAAIVMQCPKCRVEISFPVTQAVGTTACPICNTPWFDSTSDPYGKTIFPALESLQAVATHLRDLTRPQRTDIHADVRLNIKMGSDESQFD